MEPDAQYALHDAAESALRWAAHVRLTPELLHKLTRAADAQISIRLNAAGVASLGKNKKTSVLAVAAPRAAGSGSSEDEDEDEDEDKAEQYELLSFPEDPRVNHVCAFRLTSAAADGAEPPKSAGYAVHRAGTIHQKLIVQRLLDSSEKSRMKDRHARSVRESKSRASKLIDAVESPAEAAAAAAASKRRQLTVQTRTRSQSAQVGATQPGASTRRPATTRLPSALSSEEAQATRERIEAGSGQPAPDSPTRSAGDEVAPASDASLVSHETDAVAVPDPADSDMDATLPAVAPAKTQLASGARAGKQQRKRTAKDVVGARSMPITVGGPVDELAANNKDSKAVSNPPAKSPTKKRARKEAPPADEINKRLATTDAPSEREVPGAEKEVIMAAAMEPSAASRSSDSSKRGASLPTTRVKRPLQRSVPMPDLSFFPPVVPEICERVARHKSRSAIVDAADYDAFVELYEGFQRDWETLDKAYSVEFIRCEGLHVQLELASSLAQRVSLRDKLQAAARKREGLKFVQSTMAALRKLLDGIQVSITRVDLGIRQCSTGSGGVSLERE